MIRTLPISRPVLRIPLSEVVLLARVTAPYVRACRGPGPNGPLHPSAHGPLATLAIMTGSPPEITARRVELLAVLSLGADLGLGQPMEHVLRECLIAMRLRRARRSGGSRPGRSSATPPCSPGWGATSTPTSRPSGSATTSPSSPTSPASTGAGAPASCSDTSARAGPCPIAPASASPSSAPAAATSPRSSTTTVGPPRGLAAQLGLDREGQDSLGQAFERWDGRGTPGRRAWRGPSRSAAQLVQPRRRRRGLPSPGRSGRPPVAGSREIARGHAVRPGPRRRVLKRRRRGSLLTTRTRFRPGTWGRRRGRARARRSSSPGTSSTACAHGRRGLHRRQVPLHPGSLTSAVADLAGEAARDAGLPDADVVLVRRAGLVHDLGRLGVAEHHLGQARAG